MVVHVIIMARAPVAGAVKTRLSPALSSSQARDFHVACLQDVLDAVVAWCDSAVDLKPRLHLAITPAAAEPEFSKAGLRWPADMNLHYQQGGDLGERMSRAITQAFEQTAGRGRALLIGCDVPLFSPAHLDEAVQALEQAEVVFGPTIDGGYYLVAVREPPHASDEWFALANWGVDSVLQQSLRAAQMAGRRVALTATLPDVDTVEDFALVQALAGQQIYADRRSIRLIRQWLADGMAGSRKREATSPTKSYPDP